jgi:WD40 repeat protein
MSASASASLTARDPYTPFRVQPDWVEALSETQQQQQQPQASRVWLEKLDCSSGGRQFEVHLGWPSGEAETAASDAGADDELPLVVHLGEPSSSSETACSPVRAYYSAARQRLRVRDVATNRVAVFRAADRVHRMERGMRPTGDACDSSLCSLEVTRRGDVAVCATEQGRVHVLSLQPRACAEVDACAPASAVASEPLRQFAAPHFGMGVYVARLFPSERVLLTGGGDMQLRIWSLEDAQVERAAATLCGHRGGVLSADFVGRGRQLISSARDGTVRLWEVPTQQNSLTVRLPAADSTESAHLAVNHCLLLGDKAHCGSTTAAVPSSASTTASPSTERTLCAVAVAENGVLAQLDLRQAPAVAAQRLHRYEAPLNCVASLAEVGGEGGAHPAHLCVAAEDGCLLWLDRRRPNHWLRQLHVSASPLCQLSSTHYATADGYVASLPSTSLSDATSPLPSSSSPSTFLTGAPHDPVFFAHSESALFAMSQREQLIREYQQQ